MKHLLFLFLLVSIAQKNNAQELFPVAEPASTVAKGTLGVRVFDEGYRESSIFRNLAGVRLLYGLLPKLSVSATATVSDFHERSLPFDFITHDHTGGQATAGANTPAQGVAYPMIFNSADFYAKYRFLTLDNQNSHFRMALYGEYAHVSVPSHEAEPDLLIHTSGYGAGLITTYLHHHLALSLTAGFILPTGYSGNAGDKYGGVYPTTISYGNAGVYDLSIGYLLFPQVYTSYRQTNWNIYVEFMGKTYGTAAVMQRDGPGPHALYIPIVEHTPILNGGNYVDVYPGLQCIINATYRVDASVGLPLINKSYNHLYPLYTVGVQRYLYFNKRNPDKNK